MTIWKAGMLAVCVDDAWDEPCPEMPTQGSIYRVRHVVGPGRFGVPSGYLGLIVERCGAWAWNAARFRPVVSDDQPCEEDFRTLLNRFKPAKAPGHISARRHELAGFPIDNAERPSRARATHGVAAAAGSPPTAPGGGMLFAGETGREPCLSGDANARSHGACEADGVGGLNGSNLNHEGSN